MKVSTTPAQGTAPVKTQAASKPKAQRERRRRCRCRPARSQGCRKTGSQGCAKPAPKAAAKAGSAAKVAAEAKSEPEAPKSEKQEDKKYSMTGKRDPFISPVVNRLSGSGCSTGKKCLDIEQIALHGVVKSDNGMIAVVTNSLNKAYFLRENDPVFNGYVVKITVDSIVFKETFQDRLGKPFTKDVVKRILTPAV